MKFSNERFESKINVWPCNAELSTDIIMTITEFSMRVDNIYMTIDEAKELVNILENAIVTAENSRHQFDSDDI
jgi:hypothetical protein